MQIKSLDQWNEVASKLAAHGYTPWQWQYNYDDPNGLHVRFTSSQRPEEIHLVTRLREVQKAIHEYSVSMEKR